ncbi:MAG: methylenetetrahydrofolate--tRNA-(uracil(54)-C(5))-methyltransferase (FADH(2)-oxidizing) TrmFO [bacterium]
MLDGSRAAPCEVTVIGGGLAGCEAAWRLGRSGVPVSLYEMRPGKFTPAHQTGELAELVCSNSLKSDSLNNASGLLKAEMEILDSLVMKAAHETRVPAGSALAVDREKFSRRITEMVSELDTVKIVRQEVQELPTEGAVIIATGPLTSDPMAHAIARLTGESRLFFYDAIAPIVFAESIDMNVAFRASRYGKGGDDYINCPLYEKDYHAFVGEILKARRTPLRDFEDPLYFEGCLPLEVLAERGRETLAHGPLKPVGITDPQTGKRPYAVVQLRQDNAEGTLYNMVGFQTRLARPEQERIFRMIPGLERAEFARFGSIHRNTYLNSPRLLNTDISLRNDPRIFFAGQISGVEGYLESAATGIMAGINARRRLSGEGPFLPSCQTMIGALIHYITDPEKEKLEPMNANFGILESLPGKHKKADRKRLLSERAVNAMREHADRAGV